MSAPDPEIVAAAQRQVNRFMVELAVVQERLQIPRMQRREVRDDVTRACVKLDRKNQIVTQWRAPNTAEVARVDRVHAETLPEIQEWTPVERTLKDAVRQAHIDLKRAKKGEKITLFSDEKIAERSRSDRGQPYRDDLPDPKGNAVRGANPRSLSANAEGSRSRILLDGPESGVRDPETPSQEVDVEMNAKRPPRPRKGDRLASPDATRVEVASDHAVAPFDRLARQMDDTWGIDRLPELVTPETAAKFGSALGKLNEALRANDPDAVSHKAAVCIRGLQAMDAEARRLGHKPMPPEIWEIEYNGKKYGVVKDGAVTNITNRPDLTIITLREAIVGFAAYTDFPVVDKARALFSGAELTEIRPKKESGIDWEEELDDVLPF